MDTIYPLLQSANFWSIVWSCPIAFTLHVLEELPRFTPWVQRHINPDFTQNLPQGASAGHHRFHRCSLYSLALSRPAFGLNFLHLHVYSQLFL
jgi:hypothetical protein